MTLLTNNKNYFFLFSVSICLLFFSCTQIDVFEKNIVIPKYQWQNNFTATGSFTISDTVTDYNLFIVLRHTDAYKYNNIWLNIGMQSPGGIMNFQKVDLTLGNDANGWEGSGMNDIWEVRKLLNDEPRRFKKSGTYFFSIAHIMRDNPLNNIMSVGLRLEKVKEK